MSVLVVGLAAFLVSLLTLFSGFGLGTLLMPVFALFFPVPVAVGATAVVHVASNIFKVALLWTRARRTVLLGFGLPAVGAAFLGAWLLGSLASQQPLFEWHLGARRAIVTPVKVVTGGLVLLFAILEIVPRVPRLSVRWLPLGGALSGFFGGLSGHQGALRAAFLMPLGLSPPAFAATQAVLARWVDAARLVVYGAGFFSGRLAPLRGAEPWAAVLAGIVAALAGALVGRRFLPFVAVGFVRSLTGILLIPVGAGLLSGLL